MKKLLIVETGSDGNCYILDCDGHKVVLDAGIPAAEIKKALNWTLSGIEAAVITHEHHDHNRSEKELIKLGVRVLAPYHAPAGKMKTKHFSIYSFFLPHNGVTNYGFMICYEEWKMLYLTDFEYCKYSFKTHMPDAILCECNHSDIDESAANYSHVVLGHASLGVTRDFIQHNCTEHLKAVVLCHLSDANADSGLMLNGIRAVVRPGVDVQIAEKGKVIEL